MMKELSLQNSRLDGRYDITSLLGRGSYAEIYVARDTLAAHDSPHRQVVVKALNVFMQNDLDADLERTLVENFQNEAVALDRVRHPNVVSRLGHGTARDLRGTVFHYLVLEYLSGGDLARLCRQKSINVLQALKYIEQVCAGLGHAHKSGVIHRDIKPQNLLLTDDRETVKIADFGVARFSASDSPITRVGTNIYAPPEHSPMITDDGNVMTVTELTPAADVYSLAKSAYVLITCESPRFFANQPVKELPFDVRKEVWASDLLRVLQKATQTNPKDRYQTVDEFWKDLARVKLLAQSDNGKMQTRVAAPRADVTPRAHVAEGYTPLAPQRPQFNTSRDLKLKNLGIPENAPNLVVKLDSSHLPQQQKPLPSPPKDEEFLKTYIDEEEVEPVKKKSILRRAGVLLLFLAVFAGALFVTQSYLRTGKIIPEFRNPFVSLEGVAVTDINLRPESNTNKKPIGLVPKDSRVRIVNETENWYEVDIINYGRPKSPEWDDHGWISKKDRGNETIQLSR